jgi:predicted O-linked N-acetylglucosamine transferase (SPINDLY family)
VSAALNRKLSQAHERLQRGDAAGAQHLCKEVLQSAPRNPDALCLLGMTHLMAGHARDAIAPLQQALLAQPRHGATLENLGLAHLLLGEFAEAERALRIATAIPGAPASVFMRLGIALLNLDQHAEAVSVLQRAVELDPHNSDIHLNLGQAAHRTGDTAGARQHFETSLRLSPNNVDAMFNLGAICLAQQQLDDARSWFERILVSAPDRADALVNLGLVAQQQQRLDEAITHLRRAIDIDPTLAQARNNLAHTLTLQGQLEQARAEYLAALRVAPDLTEAREGLASVCVALGRFKEAIVHLRELDRKDPQRLGILAALAEALFETGDLNEAEATAKRALALDASASGPYTTLADIHSVRGELDLMVATLQAGTGKTGSVHLLSKLVFQLRRVCDWEKWRAAWQQLLVALPDTGGAVTPFSLLCEPLTPDQQLSHALLWSAQFNATGAGRDRPLATRTHRARLRIGYFSSDFYAHATAYLLAEVLEQHDRSRFEVFAYSYGPEDNSPMRARLRAACEHFVDLARDPDDVAAGRIREDDLDILIDLKGYTMGARPAILARRPCAIQIGWLGYPGTMGADFIDYLIADPVIIPPEHARYYSERVLRLPHCYQPNDRRREIAAPLARADYGLPDAAFVFCCFNQAYKITPEVFDCWMAILEAVPASVLWLLEDNRWASENLRRAALARGIDATRVVFAPRLPLAQHLARYRVADLALDTFPYTSHTTASDALWGNCLLVGLCGETFASRVSSSILGACNLAELVTCTLADYERLAQRIASDEPFRNTLRAKLESSKLNSPLFDSHTFTRDLENLYRDLAGVTPG